MSLIYSLELSLMLMNNSSFMPFYRLVTVKTCVLIHKKENKAKSQKMQKKQARKHKNDIDIAWKLSVETRLKGGMPEYFTSDIHSHIALDKVHHNKSMKRKIINFPTDDRKERRRGNV